MPEKGLENSLKDARSRILTVESTNGICLTGHGGGGFSWRSHSRRSDVDRSRSSDVEGRCFYDSSAKAYRVSVTLNKERKDLPCRNGDCALRDQPPVNNGVRSDRDGGIGK